ncbi:cytochrome b5-like [Neltuma alba]|uniref:cytochrome b5-like n=1 Tax=Neltuma alba TaxID=207710 RepID=UPI0010A4FF35|nr:cytochrome b5-like [Prosopis alba]XP_028779791.1 cytochrome b5-like [Prosopis alba]
MASKTFTFEEVAKHNHKNDCWIIIDGKVYDVTPFLEEHPGGDEVLLLAAEKDATDDFEDVGHSDSAREMMEKYLIGNVDTSTLPEKPQYRSPPPRQAPPPPAAARDQSSGVGLKVLQYLIPLLILGFAFVLQYYGKNAKPAKSEH